ncbi:MAG TPA: amidase [Acidimicrobiales bacterium]|nr:amidase [Acidimicrobiales bacterium]
MDTDTFATLDATAQAAAVAAGEVTATELVDLAIERIEKLNPQINAVIHERFDRARAEAAGDLPAGPMRGVPIVVKDLDGYLAGEPYHGGMKFLKDNAWVPGITSSLFRRLIEAGCVIVGKTNTPELGLHPSAEPLLYGPTRNPYDPTRSAGGSSGGSAAAVASGMVAAGHAGDGGGSIRIPASENGLVGLKPSRGRVSLAPDGESWAGLVARLMVTRTVRDTARFLDILNGPEPGDPYAAPPPERPYFEQVATIPASLRIGVRTHAPGGITTDPQVAAATDAAAGLLSELGHKVDRQAPAALDEDLMAFNLAALSTIVARDLDFYGTQVGKAITADDVEAGTWASAEIGRSVTGPQFLEAVQLAHAYTRRMVAWWGDWDLLITPTIPELPPTLGQFAPQEGNPLAGLFRGGGLVPFTIPFNITGQPAISLPLGQSAEGLPIGVQIVAAPYREDLLIQVASQLESACSWADRRPPLG